MLMNRDTIDVTARGVSLHVRRRPARDRKSLPLVLLHGWPASSAGWERVVDRLPPDRDVICPDLRGLGDSERTGGVGAFAKHELAEDVLSLLDVLGVDRFVVGGQDWGGVAAQELALMAPDRARALIVMNINLINNPAGNLKGFKAQMLSGRNPRWYMAFQSAPKLAEAMIPGSEELWVRYFFEQGAGENAAIPEAVLAEYVRAYRLDGTARSGANYYRAMTIDVERWASHAGAAFRQPAMLLYGAQDPFLTPEFYDGYEACFENVARVDIPAGHFVQDEKPEEVAEAIASFLNKLGG